MTSSKKNVVNTTTKIIFTFLGITTCLPWNFFMSSYDYYMVKLELKSQGGPIQDNSLSTCDKNRQILFPNMTQHIKPTTLQNTEILTNSDSETDFNVSDNVLNLSDNELIIDDIPNQRKRRDIPTQNWIEINNLCHCKAEDSKQLALYGNNDNNKVKLQELDFTYYAQKQLNDELYEKYYNSSLKQPSDSPVTQTIQTYKIFWNSSLSFVTMGTMLLSSIISNCSWFNGFKMSQITLAIYALFCSTGCLVITILMIYWEMAVKSFFFLTLFVVVVINISTGVYQTICFKVGSCQPEELFQLFIAGQAASGCIGNIVGALGSKIVESMFPAERTSEENMTMNQYLATGFFLVGILSILITISGMRKLVKMKIFESESDQNNEIHPKMEDSMIRSQMSHQGPATLNDSDRAENESLIINIQKEHETSSDSSKSSTQAPAHDLEQLEERNEPVLSTVAIIKKSGEYYFSIWLCYTVTLSVFPTLVSQVKSSSIFPGSDKGADSCGVNVFNPIFLKAFVFLTFNIGDFIGRMYTSSLEFYGIDDQNSGYKCLRLSILRAVFYIVFFCCNITGYRRFSILSNDYFFIFAMLVFSTTNGYLSTKAFMYAPSMFKNPANMGVAGGLNVSFLTFGLLSGALLSFPVTEVYKNIQNSVEHQHLQNMLLESAYDCLSACNNL